MNELIEEIFNNFIVDGVNVPVSYMFYEGHGEPYVVYMQQDATSSLSGDDDLIGYVDYYDFDVYSKGNYLAIIDKVKEILKENNYVWQPSRTSMDFFEPDTGYYHKTLNFAIFREEEI